MSGANDQADLRALLNVPTQIEIGSETIELTPLKFGELARTLELAGPMLAELGEPDSRWIDLVLRHAERLVPLTAHLSRRPEDWVAGLALDEAADLLGYCVAVNADFFARRVGPSLARMMVGLTGASATTPSGPNPDPAAGPQSSGS
jgi:hypothetical protein